MRRSRSWRGIDVGGVRYRWRFGRGTIEVRLGREVVLRRSSYDLAGITPDSFERGQWKRTSDGAVTPAMIRRAILRSRP